MGTVYESEGVRWAEYVVGCLDILGQSGEMRVLSVLPSNRAEADGFRLAAHKSYDAVRMIQKWLQRSPDQGRDPAKAHPYYGGLSDVQRREVAKLGGKELKHHFFGDTFLIYGRMLNDEEEPAIANVLALLSKVALVMFGCLSGKIPLRGGIEVGVGAEMEGRGIYGPALIDPHRLEAEVAQYPRIVIGPRLTSRLSALAQSAESGQDLHDINRAFVEGCLPYIGRDVDGWSIVDYLGEGVSRVVEGDPVTENGRKLMDFVEGECERFGREKNTKLAFRYRLLRDYCSRRLSEWP